MQWDEASLREGERRMRERCVLRLQGEARGLSPLVRSLLLCIAADVALDVGPMAERPTLPDGLK